MSRVNPTLALWIQDRLDDREAILWAVRSQKRITGKSGEEIVTLLTYLVSEAAKIATLSDQHKLIWRMLLVAAQERFGRSLSWQTIPFPRLMRAQRFRIEDVPRLVDSLRPRLSAKEPSYGDLSSERAVSADPRQWVAWDFETESGPVANSNVKLDKQTLANLPVETLASLIGAATTALDRAVSLAAELGWLDTNQRYAFRVSRVWTVPSDSDDSNDDPDEYNHCFAPIVRLMSAALDALTERNVAAAKNEASRWNGRVDSLYVRLTAYSGWKPQLLDGNEVGQLLIKLGEEAFWNRNFFPEIASLRALRWNDLPPAITPLLVLRLLRGPSAEALRGHDVPPEALLYLRDLELARIVDHAQQPPDEFQQAVVNRRAADHEFPRIVNVVEEGLPGPRVFAVPQGNAAAFVDVPRDRLVPVLAEASRTHSAFHGDDADAYAKVYKAEVLAALEQHRQHDDDSLVVWQLLLSYPHEKENVDKELNERIAARALHLPDPPFGQLADRLCYWLEGVDQQYPDFAGARLLWARLLPFAIAKENAKAEKHDADGATESSEEADLSSAALNAPLGHLLSIFLRRCPTMPNDGDRPALPEALVLPLKHTTGRARALVANRLIVQANYFRLADRRWLDEFALAPMSRDGVEGVKLWEAFARYAEFPAYELWSVLQEPLLAKLSPGSVSTEAQQRLGEMAIIAWFYSMQPNTQYVVDAVAVRRSLTLTTDDVRASASWRFAGLVEEYSSMRKKDGEDTTDSWTLFGAAFFDQVWPIEPMLQSRTTADDFARVPVRVGESVFCDAVRRILPYLRAFDVWDVESDLGLNEAADPIIQAHPTEALALVNACISDEFGTVHDLGRVLKIIREARPELATDPRMHRLLRHVERQG